MHIAGFLQGLFLLLCWFRVLWIKADVLFAPCFITRLAIFLFGVLAVNIVAIFSSIAGLVECVVLLVLDSFAVLVLDGLVDCKLANWFLGYFNGSDYWDRFVIFTLIFLLRLHLILFLFDLLEFIIKIVRIVEHRFNSWFIVKNCLFIN